MKYHYTYRITNIKLSLYYYGVRTSKNILPKEDLGINYFSSSSNKEFILDQKLNPQNYKYKIIKICSTRVKAIELEIKLHNKFNVGINESFYNKVKQTSTGFDCTDCYETHKKISNTLKTNGYVDSYETRQKKSNSAKNRPTISQETRDKISKVHKGKYISQETINKMLKSKEGKDYGPNYNALNVNIYDNHDNLMYICKNNFNKICDENILPKTALRKSIKENGSKIYINLDNGNLAKITKSGLIKYKGWYAKELN